MCVCDGAVLHVEGVTVTQFVVSVTDMPRHIGARGARRWTNVCVQSEGPGVPGDTLVLAQGAKSFAQERSPSR